jgi:hypothetical protein
MVCSPRPSGTSVIPGNEGNTLPSLILQMHVGTVEEGGGLLNKACSRDCGACVCGQGEDSYVARAAVKGQGAERRAAIDGAALKDQEHRHGSI